MVQSYLRSNARRVPAPKDSLRSYTITGLHDVPHRELCVSPESGGAIVGVVILPRSRVISPMSDRWLPREALE
jgi:hypothetical protein